MDRHAIFPAYPVFPTFPGKHEWKQWYVFMQFVVKYFSWTVC